MITEFVAGKYYKCSLSKRSGAWNKNGKMDFMLDGNWHKCKAADESHASFYDSPDPEFMWEWGDLNYFQERDYLNLDEDQIILNQSN